MIDAPGSSCPTLAFSAAGFMATSTFGVSPGVAMSRAAKWIWKLLTPASVPAGARISAGKFGNVARSLPTAAVASVNRPPASCMPSPLSPANRTMTRSRFWVRCPLRWTLCAVVASVTTTTSLRLRSVGGGGSNAGNGRRLRSGPEEVRPRSLLTADLTCQAPPPDGDRTGDDRLPRLPPHGPPRPRAARRLAPVAHHQRPADHPAGCPRPGRGRDRRRHGPAPRRRRRRGDGPLPRRRHRRRARDHHELGAGRGLSAPVAAGRGARPPGPRRARREDSLQRLRGAPDRQRPRVLAAGPRDRALPGELPAVRRRPPPVARASDLAAGGRPHLDAHPEEDEMQLDAHVGVELVAVEQPDELTVLLDLKAPDAPASGPRPPAAVQVVLDRSGSMAGERLEAAQRALVALVDRLDPQDRFGLVAFDDATHVVVPAGPLGDKPAIRHAIASLGPGGMTNLSGGLLRGLQEARRAKTDAGATVLLVSDGHANDGIVDPDQLGSVAATARRHGVTVSTVGIGLDYDETLLAALARAGQGGHAFALDGDAAAAAVAGEVEGLLSKTVQAASLTIRPTDDVQAITLWNELPSHAIEQGVVAELGDLWAGEERKLLVTLAVPAMPALGLAQVATLELTYVALPDLAEQTITMPLHVNVVPGDQAAGRIADPKVRTELLFQQAQEAKRRAADALQRGDHLAARAAYQDVAARIGDHGDPELAREAGILLQLDGSVAAGEAGLAAKTSRMEHADKARQRGRRRPGM